MLASLTRAVDDAALVPRVGLVPGELQSEQADDRQAALAAAADTFDPDGLYALEVERDLAASLLVESIPADLAVALTRSDRVQRNPGLGVNREREWSAIVLLGRPAAGGEPAGPSICRRAGSPTQAVDLLLAAWREHVATTPPAAPPAPTGETRVTTGSDGQFRASARLAGAGTPWASAGMWPTRERAEAEAAAVLAALVQQVDDDARARELGTIKPATAADFLESVEARCGRSDFLVIDPGGRVTIPASLGYLCPDELLAMRSHVDDHNRAVAKASAAGRQVA